MMEQTGHWAVTVERDGECILTIESNCLAGRDLSPDDEFVIRTAARHLLSFIGNPIPLYEWPDRQSQ